MSFNDTSLIPFASPGDQPKMPPEMKVLLDSVLNYANTGARRGGQTAAQGRALGEALQFTGGVYGHNLQAQASSDANSVAKSNLDLEARKAFQPMPGVGAPATPTTPKTTIGQHVDPFDLLSGYKNNAGGL